MKEDQVRSWLLCMGNRLCVHACFITCCENVRQHCTLCTSMGSISYIGRKVLITGAEKNDACIYWSFFATRSRLSLCIVMKGCKHTTVGRTRKYHLAPPVNVCQSCCQTCSMQHSVSSSRIRICIVPMLNGEVFAE